MKKRLLSMLIVMFLAVPIVCNAESYEARIGTTDYSTLGEAIDNATPGDTITILDHVVINGGVQVINKDLTIDLNGFSISRTNRVFQVQGAEFTLTGQGEVFEIVPDFAPVVVKGSNNPADTNYSVVNVGPNVKLTGWCGIFITPYLSSGAPYAYGVVINVDGELNGVNDSSGAPGSGFYINGQIKHKENYSVINLNETAKINATGAGLYVAGYSLVNVNGAAITGVDSGIAAKSGIININGGSVKATGEDRTPTAGYGNGVNPSGAAIQIESNSGYAGDIELNIKGGNISSEKGIAMYEYLGAGNTTTVSDIAISGGTFASASDKPVLAVSDSFKETNKEFITGGTFSTDPSEFVNPEYASKDSNGNFVVKKPVAPSEPTVPSVEKPNENSNNVTPVATANNNVANPETGDSIGTSIALAALGILGLAGSAISMKKFS